MNTHHLHRLSFHKLELHSPSASLHSFVLIRNSLLRSIRTQQQEDSWLDACFDELAPDNAHSRPTRYDAATITLMEDEDSDGDLMEQQHQHRGNNDDTRNRHLILLEQTDKDMDDIDMLLLEEEYDDDDDDEDDDDDDDEDEGPISPIQHTHYQSAPSFDSPTYFISMDDDDDDDNEKDRPSTSGGTTTTITTTTIHQLNMNSSCQETDTIFEETPVLSPTSS